MSLYTIDPKYLELLQKDKYTPGDLAQLDALSNDERHKIVTIAGYIQNIRAELEAVTKSIDNMAKRKKRLENKIDGLCEIIISKMNFLNIDKISDSPHYEVMCYKNRERVEVFNKDILPRDYFKRHEAYTINRELINQDISKGIHVPGAELVSDKRVVIK